MSEAPKPLMALARFAPAEYSISPLVDAKWIPPVPPALALASLEDALVDGDAAREGVGGGEVEGPGAVQSEAPAPALAPVPPEPV